MEDLLFCPLCESPASFYHASAIRSYWRCTSCASVFLNPSQRLSPREERDRYELHNNDVNDPRYQKFVSPLVQFVMQGFSTEHRGLDFGAGTGPVITKILREAGYDMHLYDPYFHDNPSVLEQTYDFIICCEVIEHFYDPKRSFSLLQSLLRKPGSVLCRTSLLTDKIDFSSWYYKDDETHTFFYTPNAVSWIAEQLGFSSSEIIDDTIIHFRLS